MNIDPDLNQTEDFPADRNIYWSFSEENWTADDQIQLTEGYTRALISRRVAPLILDGVSVYVRSRSVIDFESKASYIMDWMLDGVRPIVVRIAGRFSTIEVPRVLPATILFVLDGQLVGDLFDSSNFVGSKSSLLERISSMRATCWSDVERLAAFYSSTLNFYDSVLLGVQEAFPNLDEGEVESFRAYFLRNVDEGFFTGVGHDDIFLGGASHDFEDEGPEKSQVKGLDWIRELMEARKEDVDKAITRYLQSQILYDALLDDALGDLAKQQIIVVPDGRGRHARRRQWVISKYKELHLANPEVSASKLRALVVEEYETTFGDEIGETTVRRMLGEK